MQIVKKKKDVNPSRVRNEDLGILQRVQEQTEITKKSDSLVYMIILIIIRVTLCNTHYGCCRNSHLLYLKLYRPALQ
jgi:hypothetical protein